MNTGLFVNANIVFSENLFIVPIGLDFKLKRKYICHVQKSQDTGS